MADRLHLRESFWTKLARPVDGIMYHGWQALVPSEGTSGYRYTHPETKEEFRRLRLDLAPNDRPGVWPGVWQIRVRELASGLTATRYVRVTAGAVAR